MSKRIFVSYSSPDQSKADAIREALETADASLRHRRRGLGHLQHDIDSRHSGSRGAGQPLPRNSSGGEVASDQPVTWNCPGATNARREQGLPERIYWSAALV